MEREELVILEPFMAKRSDTQAPWDRRNPKKASGRRSKKMTSAQKGEARDRARRAGRPYPNLIDNMAVVKKKRQTKKRVTKQRKK